MKNILRPIAMRVLKSEMRQLKEERELCLEYYREKEALRKKLDQAYYREEAMEQELMDEIYELRSKIKELEESRN